MFSPVFVRSEAMSAAAAGSHRSSGGGELWQPGNLPTTTGRPAILIQGGTSAEDAKVVHNKISEHCWTWLHSDSYYVTKNGIFHPYF